VETTNFNGDTFNKDTRYHVLLEYGPFEGHLGKLASEIRGKMFHGFEMQRSRLELIWKGLYNFNFL